MIEEKVGEGIYFTNYRKEAEHVHDEQCCHHPKKPDGKHFITLDECKLLEDPNKMAYVLGDVFRKTELLLASNQTLIHERELHTDPDILDAILGNAVVLTNYF